MISSTYISDDSKQIDVRAIQTLAISEHII